MAENESNEKKKELVQIDLDIFPEFTGPRIKRDFKCPDGVHKFTIMTPIVMTDEEAQSIYGVDLATIYEKGCLQTTYARDTFIANTIKEDYEKGVDFGALDDVGKYVNVVQSALSTPPAPRSSARAEEKKALATIRELGLDDPEELAEMKKFIAKRRARKQNGQG